MSIFNYGYAKDLISDVADLVGHEWSIDDISALAKMIKTNPCAPFYVADRQPLISAIADAILESGESYQRYGAQGDKAALIALADGLEDANLESAIKALASAVKIDSEIAGNSVASNYMDALRKVAMV